MKIGVLSDTHGYFDPKILEIFAGVDHILHGGDIGTPAILIELENLAPVTAVLGNTDAGLSVRETEVITLDHRVFLVHHIVEVANPSEEWKQRIQRIRPDVVVFGHTHKPYEHRVGRTLYLNPGYAGRKRFDLPRSVVVLETRGDAIETRLFPL